MNQTHPIHVTVMFPREHRTAHFGLIDPARHVAHELKRIGVDVSFQPKSLREDAKNLVFGSFAGLQSARHIALALFNLEQLEEGKGGFADWALYLNTMKENYIVDYHAKNVSMYREPSQTNTVPIYPFLYAKHLPPSEIPLEKRSIDLLFFGTKNDRRLDFIDRVLGYDVDIFIPAGPVYGPERDDLIRNSKAVLNYGHYEADRFEQTRGSIVLSLGTPLISERRDAPPEYEENVFWLDGDIETFFRKEFLSPSFYERSRKMLSDFSQIDGTSYAQALFEFMMTVEPLDKVGG